MEAKHKTLYPGAIHDQATGRFLRVKCYRRDDALTGKQAIIFRQVVADYLVDLAIRQAANANGTLTANAVKRAAIAAIKVEIDNGTYPDLLATL